MKQDIDEMLTSDHLTTTMQTQLFAGSVLFVAGSDLYNPLNQPSQHLPYHLANHLKHLDLVGYARFYDGPPAPAWKRLRTGMQNVLRQPVHVSDEGNIHTIAARRLRLPGIIDLLLQDLWMYAILRPYLKHEYEVGIIDGPESASFARLLKKTGRVKRLIYYDIDYYPAVHPHWANQLSKREQMLCDASDAVASVSRPLAELREKQGARLAAVVPNGVDFANFYTANLLRKEHPLTLIYTGSLDMRWGIDLPIRSMPLILQQYPDARLIIAGRGRAEQELSTLAVSLGVQDHVYFAGFVPYAELPALLSQADIGVATSRQDPFRWYASPLKLVEYMAAGLPVICSGGGEAERMIDESQAGINIPFEPGAFARAVKTIWDMPVKFRSFRESAIQYAQGRSWEQMGILMSQLVTRVADFDRIE